MNGTAGITVHIVSFDVPYPPDYGGVIDVYYKIRSLHSAGAGVILHCYTHKRPPARDLEDICREVHYYPRRTGLAVNLGLMPYIVAGRMADDLSARLSGDRHPVIFEGLHTCGILDHPALAGRKLVYRESNIEHQYYRHLASAERNPLRKIHFLAESARLYRFQKVLKHASLMLAVSQDDTRYLASTFPGQQVLYMPSFHGDEEVRSIAGRGTYALYQGKLSVPENSRAAAWLIREVWNAEMPELVIAGSEPPGWLGKMVAGRRNVRLISNPSGESMETLIREAHLNLLVTFQPTGLKLKLLNALFNGRHCLVNPAMVAGTSLAGLCTVAHGPQALRDAALELFTQEFGYSMAEDRKRRMPAEYSNIKNCTTLVNLLT